MSENGRKTASLICNLDPKFFFIAGLGFEQLSSTISGGAMPLVRQPKTAGFRPISRYEYIVHRLQRCYAKHCQGLCHDQIARKSSNH